MDLSFEWSVIFLTFHFSTVDRSVDDRNDQTETWQHFV
jgi:hypothetical protein